jgi:hypothetical protein
MNGFEYSFEKCGMALMIRMMSVMSPVDMQQCGLVCIQSNHGAKIRIRSSIKNKSSAQKLADELIRSSFHTS